MINIRKNDFLQHSVADSIVHSWESSTSPLPVTSKVSQKYVKSLVEKQFQAEFVNTNLSIRQLYFRDNVISKRFRELQECAEKCKRTEITVHAKSGRPDCPKKTRNRGEISTPA